MQDHILLLVNSYVTDQDPRRGAKFQLQLRSYAEHGWHIGLIALQQRDYRSWRVLAKGGLVEDRESGLPVLRDCLTYGIMGRPIWSAASPLGKALANRAISAYIRRHGKPDLTHAHGSQWAGVAALAAFERWRIPYVLTEHMSNYTFGKVGHDLLPLMHAVFDSARICLPVSTSVGLTLEGLFGDSVKPWITVPNMLDTDLFNGPKGGNGSDKSSFTFVSVSRLSEVKGFDILLKAFASAFSETAVFLRIAGDGPARQKLRELVRDLRIDEKVTFLGQLSRQQVASELERASAYVLASHYETFSIPVIEAQAVGLPTVATQCGGPEDLIDESNGLLVPPNNIEALALAMRSMVSGIRDFDRASISRRCLSKYSPTAVLRQLGDVYAQAAH